MFIIQMCMRSGLVVGVGGVESNFAYVLRIWEHKNYLVNSCILHENRFVQLCILMFSSFFPQVFDSTTHYRLMKELFIQVCKLVL